MDEYNSDRVGDVVKGDGGFKWSNTIGDDIAGDDG